MPDGFQVPPQADPASGHRGANAGVDPAHVLSAADGVVVPRTVGTRLPAPFARTAARKRTARKRTARKRTARKGPALAAGFTVVAGMGGGPVTLAAGAARAHELGAGRPRLYHAGLALDDDAAALREALTRG